MALDYKQSASLRINQYFQGRIATAALGWAQSKMSGPVDVTQPQARNEYAYAQEVYRNPNGEAAKLQPGVVQDPAVQAADIDQQTGIRLSPIPICKWRSRRPSSRWFSGCVCGGADARAPSRPSWRLSGLCSERSRSPASADARASSPC